MIRRAHPQTARRTAFPRRRFVPKKRLGLRLLDRLVVGASADTIEVELDGTRLRACSRWCPTRQTEVDENPFGDRLVLNECEQAHGSCPAGTREDVDGEGSF